MSGEKDAVQPDVEGQHGTLLAVHFASARKYAEIKQINRELYEALLAIDAVMDRYAERRDLTRTDQVLESAIIRDTVTRVSECFGGRFG